jgi:hypothetical protein
MKTLGRILVILLAAGAISGATYALAHSGVVPTNLARGRGGFEGQRPSGLGAGNVLPNQGFAGPGQFPDGGRDGGREGDREGGGLFGLAVVARNFVLMAIVIALGAVGVRLVRQRRKPKQPVAV